MAEKSESEKLLMELQMEELRASLGITKEESDTKKKPDNTRSEANAKIAALYEAAGEYEAELERFEAELGLIESHGLSELVVVLGEAFPGEEGSVEQELKSVVEAGWRQLAEVKQTHPVEQIALIDGSEFDDILSTLKAQYPEYEGDFEAQMKEILVKRWEMLIEIKKEHIAEEREEIEEHRGLKPDYARGVYRKYHSLD
jgi:hypothetical protein